MSEFSLIHHGSDRWSVKNGKNEWWCSENKWVHESSSYWAFDPDCVNTIFSYQELKEFILDEFEVKL